MTKPLNVEVLIERGYCCGCGCVNCPYVPKGKRGSSELVYKTEQRTQPKPTVTKNTTSDK